MELARDFLDHQDCRLTILDLSYNNLCGGCGKEILKSQMEKEERRFILRHLDLSYNKFDMKECEEI